MTLVTALIGITYTVAAIALGAYLSPLLRGIPWRTIATTIVATLTNRITRPRYQGRHWATV